MVEIQGNNYEIMKNFRDGWDQEKFNERYSEILGKFDYIVGDWGYDQLRLKGFFDEDHPKSAFDNRLSFTDEYIQEYCNFGCPYFILKKTANQKT